MKPDPEIQKQYEFLLACAHREELVLCEHQGRYVVMHHHVSDDGELEFFPIALLLCPHEALTLLQEVDHVQTPEGDTPAIT